MPLLIWLIDDTPEWHDVTDRSIDELSGVEIEHFHTGAGALMAFEQRARHDPGQLPRVVLLDYYLAQERGEDVCRQLRALEPRRHRCIVVGHSSVPSCSERIVAAGGDLVVHKRCDREGRNPALIQWLGELRG